MNPIEELESIIAARGVTIGVIATPGIAAQEVCDRLVAAGVTSILNFAPVVLSVPAGVDVRKVDLSVELQILAFHAQRKSLREAETRPSVTRRQRRPVAADTASAAAPAAAAMVGGAVSR